MNKILVEVSVGELLDKISILEIKKEKISDPSSLGGPSLDGTPDQPNKMFMFANNVSSPNCCPSTFSTDTGCVCTTDKQRDFVASRGYNNL